MNEPLIHPKQSDWPDWHHQPLKLSTSEIDRPLSVIEQFFDCYTLPNIRACLHDWQQDALAKESVECKRHVFTREQVEKLIEATWVIYKNGFGNQPSEEVVKGNKDAEDWDKEILNKPPRKIEAAKADPLMAIHMVFKDCDFDSFRSNLHNWFHIALTTDDFIYEDGGHRKGLLTLYEELETLLEALYVKQGGNPNKIRVLTKEQIADPETAIHLFFKTFPIAYIRRELADWLEAGIGYGGPYPGELSAIQVLYTHNDLICLVEAAYHFNQSIIKERKQ